MPKSDEAKAAFMREVGATHAEWEWPPGHAEETLKSLTLAPQTLASAPGPAARMAAFHEKNVEQERERRHATMFASAAIRPRLENITPPTSVPRAERAKEAARRGSANEG